jgi:hypothetical protein
VVSENINPQLSLRTAPSLVCTVILEVEILPDEDQKMVVQDF